MAIMRGRVMLERYDLSEMLKEIREDERMDIKAGKHVSQDDIKKLLEQKRSDTNEIK